MLEHLYNITMKKLQAKIYEHGQATQKVHVAMHHFKRVGSSMERVAGKTHTVYNVDLKKVDAAILKALEELEKEGQ